MPPASDSVAGGSIPYVRHATASNGHRRTRTTAAREIEVTRRRYTRHKIAPVPGHTTAPAGLGTPCGLRRTFFANQSPQMGTERRKASTRGPSRSSQFAHGFRSAAEICRQIETNSRLDSGTSRAGIAPRSGARRHPKTRTMPTESDWLVRQSEVQGGCTYPFTVQRGKRRATFRAIPASPIESTTGSTGL